MTESIRRSGEYEYSQGDAQTPTASFAQPADPHRPAASSGSPVDRVSPVNPEWPPPPAYAPATPPAYATGGHGGHDGYGGHGGQGFGGHGFGGHGFGGHDGGGTALPTAAPAGPPPAPRKRAKGPLALLAAVAIAAAAVGGGTAYAFQQLTGKDTVAAGTTSTNVVPSSQRGSIAAIAKAVSPSVVEITATLNNGTSTGSGVIISSGGEIVTNNHVIAGASTIKARTSNGDTYTAQVVGTDSSKDLALIKLAGASGLKPASLGDSSAVAVGDQVVAIGSPEGLTGTVTSGIVSSLNRDVTVSTDESQGQGQGQGQGDGQWPFEFGGRHFNGDTGSSTTTYKAIQTDASLNPGNSGGALIDAAGNIIGINSAMYSAATSGSGDSSGAGSVGLGFAIPIDTVKADLAKLRSGAQN
ncbi:S1C family serine protease [Streptomyces sp. PsTaAH-124]|uniref:S1C family serine protease n=1 Tax=Streptomyces sp. PsTaAH-124 TaxID=1157638 RepID=UPI00037EB3DC|nr:trypsin-like peptidase domain-containing protein [Streptomyces sp. PsTaAH-124]